MNMSIVSGIGWHMVGAASAACFYAPIDRVKKWSWETTWSVAGLFSWILLPCIVSAFLLPSMSSFYGAVDSAVLWKMALFGAVWGVGNISYGLTMRYLGMSLGIGIAIGVTLVVGTIMPPILHGEFGHLFGTNGGQISLLGVAVALIGVAIVSTAGHLKEQALGKTAEEFNLVKGLLLAVMCGIFSSGMSFAIDAGKPVTDAALSLGVNPLYAALPSYVIIMGGGAVINLGFCFIRLAMVKKLSIRQDMALTSPALMKNGAMAATGGIMWYLQFFFYAWGAASIPANLGFVNWCLHMSGYVLFGGLVGLVLGEWKGVGSRPMRLLCFGMLVIVLASNIVGVGMAS
jgi:L-rhamnose-H+ transport protein